MSAVSNSYTNAKSKLSVEAANVAYTYGILKSMGMKDRDLFENLKVYSIGTFMSDETKTEILSQFKGTAMYNEIYVGLKGVM